LLLSLLAKFLHCSMAFQKTLCSRIVQYSNSRLLDKQPEQRRKNAEEISSLQADHLAKLTIIVPATTPPSQCCFSSFLNSHWDLLQAQLMAEDIGPLLKEMREGELLKDLAYLMKFATKSGRDLGVLSKSVLTSENRHLLQDSVSTLSKALKQVEVSLCFSSGHRAYLYQFCFVIVSYHEKD
jgi:hypothetical protein